MAIPRRTYTHMILVCVLSIVLAGQVVKSHPCSLTEDAQLTASDAAAGQGFGISVSLSGGSAFGLAIGLSHENTDTGSRPVRSVSIHLRIRGLPNPGARPDSRAEDRQESKSCSIRNRRCSFWRPVPFWPPLRRTLTAR